MTTSGTLLLFSLLVAFFQSSAFTIPTNNRQANSHRSSLNAEKRPVVVVGRVDHVGGEPLQVVGSASAAMVGAALALSARDLLKGDLRLPTQEAPPPAQPITMLTSIDQNAPAAIEDSLYEYLEETLWDSPALLVRRTQNKEYPVIADYESCLNQRFDNQAWNNRPILHVVMEGGTAAEALLDQQLRDDVFFLGIEPVVPFENDGVVSPEMAQQCGSILQRILDFYQTDQEAAAVSLDSPLLLSMLQANCLPKSSTNRDSFAVHPSGSQRGESSTGLLVEYLYDYDNAFGGTDPLSCPTNEFSIPVPYEPSSKNTPRMLSKAGSNAAAAAYTVLRGHGMESVLSMCIAESIEALFWEMQQHSSFECPPYTWSSIERVATLSEQVRDYVREEQVVRQRYIEFGYK